MIRVAATIFFSAGLVLAQPSAAGDPQLSGLDQAILEQRTRISEEPKNGALWNDLGNLLTLAEEGGEAQSAYLRAIDIQPGNASAHFNLALALQQAGQLEEAVSHYHSTLEIDSEHGWALYQIGAILEAQQERREAVEYYTKAFSLDPDLLFAEVNPHIVQNELILESLLRRVRTDPRDFTLPRIYAHRDRIVEALVPPVPEEAAEPAITIEEKPADETVTVEETATAEKGEVGRRKQLNQVRRRRNKRKARPPAD